MWGEEKVVYRCVRKYRGKSATISSDSESESDQESSEEDSGSPAKVAVKQVHWYSAIFQYPEFELNRS